jgi:hypothetical protein
LRRRPIIFAQIIRTCKPRQFKIGKRLLKGLKLLEGTRGSQRDGWAHTRNGKRHVRGNATEVRWDYIMVSFPAPIQDRSLAQRMDSQREIHISDYRPGRPGDRCAARDFERRYLRENSPGPEGLFRRGTFCRSVSQPVESEDAEDLRILARLRYRNPTACPPRLSCFT